MPITDYRLGNQLLGLSNCPHCGVASPVLSRVWASEIHTPRNDGGRTRKWAAFACTTCGGVAVVNCDPAETVSNARVTEMFPAIWSADAVIPARARNYLDQAMRTLSTPDASVVMSSSAIDAMLKDKQLTEGSLYVRINAAVEGGIITQGMADWAHRVRLDANNPRHADEVTPHLTRDDADRAFEYAKSLAEIIYVLPSKMPPAAT